MRVCIRKADGRIIESQSGKGDLDILVRNAVSAGLSADDVTVTEIADDEARRLIGEQDAVIVFPTITRKQALLWLLAIDKTDADVEAAIATIKDPKAQAAAQIEWRYSNVYHRAHPLFDQLGHLLGLDAAAMDAAFRLAAKL